MLHSMTAFGQSVIKASHAEYSWEIRSVNQRFLDISVRLSEPLKIIESTVKKKVASCVHRGKVEVSLNLTTSTSNDDQLVLNQNLLQQLVDAIAQVDALPISTGKCDPISLLQWPGLASFELTVDDAMIEAAVDSFDSALKDFLQSRKREGAQIASMLNTRAEQVAELLKLLKKHRSSVVQRQREKLLIKLGQLDVEHDAGRLEQELVYASQRLDIDEELDRIQSHLHELSLVFEREEPVGRRLDFLMQEFNREVNTVASKSSDSETTKVSIEMKVLIEQMREQIQNVE